MTLTEDEIQDKLQNFRGWELVGGKLQKVYPFKDFMTALDMINKVGVVAEHHDHHPDMLISYNKVTFMLGTHSANGITDKDFQLVREIDKLAVTMI